MFPCELEEVPEDNNEAPEFSFTLQGPGINRAFVSGDDLENLQVNILENSTYDFLLLGTDAGGVEFFSIQIAANVMLNFQSVPADVQVSTTSFATIASKEGDINNSMTGLSIDSQIQVVGDATHAPEIDLEVRDFASPANSIFAKINVLIVSSEDDTGVKVWSDDKF